MATCMFIMQWSRPDVYDAVRSLARLMNAPQEVHLQALMTLMKYMVSTRNWGLVLAPKALWDSKRNFKFEIWGRLDSDYATNPDD